MRRFLIFVALVAICVYGLYRWTATQPDRAPEKFTPAAGPKLTDDDVHVLEAMDAEYTKLVQVVVPSVVSIIATKRIETPEVQDPFELFFGRRRAQHPQTEEERSLGSGVIVSAEGHILTNEHVVANVDEVMVRLSDGQEATAHIVGEDAATDIAVLKVTGVKVTPLPFGDSDQVKVGQRVIAIGNPFGFDETVTQGIISAKGRAMEESANDFFQTDAAINPGNSGGPLVDLRGEIIGINSSIYGSNSGSWQGLGFAIPANTARRALEAIIKTGHVAHGYLGVMVPNAELSERMGLPAIDGAYVNAVTPNSPAQKAGIRRGDIIVSIGEHPVHNFTELRNQIAGVDIGSQVAIGLQRGSDKVTLDAKVIEQPNDGSGATAQEAQSGDQPADEPGAAQNGLLVGVHVMPIPEGHEQLLPPHAHGVMVESIDQNCPANGTLKPADVIEEIDHAPINSVAEYREAASLLGGQQVLLSICRDKRRSFTVVTAQ
jgi:serine protease Do